MSCVHIHTANLLRQNKMYSISEGPVPITRNNNGPGCLVHRAHEGGFMTLYSVSCECLDANDVAVIQDQQITMKILIGSSSHAITATHHDRQPVLHNFWVSQNEEVWVSCSHPHAYLVYGFVSKRVCRAP